MCKNPAKATREKRRRNRINALFSELQSAVEAWGGADGAEKDCADGDKDDNKSSILADAAALLQKLGQENAALRAEQEADKRRLDQATESAMVLQIQNANLKSLLIGEGEFLGNTDDLTIDPLVSNMFDGETGVAAPLQQGHEKDPDTAWIGAAGVGFHQEHGRLWMTAEDLDTSNDALLHPPLA